ncbi:MAG: cytochrome C [Geobacteraceae bacterium]|nr:cytochrome C [Geobacteraceae bacterium]
MGTVTKATVLAAAALLISAPAAFAFHSGGVADCEGCHSMHNSYEGAANVTGMAQYQSGPYLLKAQDASGSCLNCHAAADTTGSSYHIATLGVTPNDSSRAVEGTPGGDFAWLKKTMTFSVRGNPVTVDGDRKGHNIVAADFGYTADKVLTTAPGGTYPAKDLACSSCHDPHGTYRRFADGSQARTGLPIFNSGSYTSSNSPTAGVSAVGVYRILAGVGYQPKSLSGSFAFPNPAPDAVAKSSYNGVSTTVNTAAGQKDLVAYGQGMSEYCANCHTAMHLDTYASGTKGLVHPAGNGAKLTAPIAANYNAYVTSGVMTGTVGYSAIAPYELGTNDYAAMKAFVAAPVAATTSNNVNCLSCHRAHASGFESMARYNLFNEFMTVADAAGVAMYDSSTTEGKINTGYTVQQQTDAYNGRPATAFGPMARNNCNKCHAKD